MEKLKGGINLKKPQKTISAFYFFLEAGILVSQLLLFKYPIGILNTFIIILVNVILFILCVGMLEDKQKKIAFILVRLSVIFACLDAISVLISKISKSLDSEMSPMPIVILLGGSASIAVGYVLFNKNKEKEELVYSFKALFKFSQETGTKEDLSVKLCNNCETKLEVRIKLNDRFLHMLIIGPTGCGKTSQILIPMILQDIMKKLCGVIVIEPKGDLAEKVYAMGKISGDDVLYFNPTHPDCPSFNPLCGKEDEVIENITTTFKMLNPDSSTYFQDINDSVLRKGLMVLKRIEKHYTNPKTGISNKPATLIKLNELIHNTNNQGRQIVMEFSKLPCSKQEAKQNEDTAAWFLTDYFNEKSKLYENASGIRTQVSKLISNKYLRKVLNPEDGITDIVFDEILAKGKRVAISTAQGELRDLGKYLGYFIIYSLQSAVFKRPKPEKSRIPCFLYIDEFQTYSNPGFSDMLTQGRSYRVACHLATQARDQMAMGGGRDGANFVKLVSTNARNLVIFPGVSAEDAEYYSKQFGQKKVIVERTSESRQKFDITVGFKPMNYPSESVSKSEELVPVKTPTDIMYKPAKKITYRIIQDMNVMQADDGDIEYIDAELNEQLDRIALGYDEEQRRKQAMIDKESEEGISYEEGSKNNDKNGENNSQAEDNPVRELNDEEACDDLI